MVIGGAEAVDGVLDEVQGNLFRAIDNNPVITDKRTDHWSQDFVIWKINFGLWAVGLGWTME